MKIEELQNLRNRKELQKWVRFLVDGNRGLEELFIDYIYDKDKPIVKCISELQDFLKLGLNRGQDITAEILNEQIEDHNIIKLLDYLEELFLEPIPRHIHIIKRLEIAIQNGIRGEDFINWEKKNKRVLSLIITPEMAINRRVAKAV